VGAELHHLHAELQAREDAVAREPGGVEHRSVVQVGARARGADRLTVRPVLGLVGGRGRFRPGEAAVVHRFGVGREIDPPPVAGERRAGVLGLQDPFLPEARAHPAPAPGLGALSPCFLHVFLFRFSQFQAERRVSSSEAADFHPNTLLALVVSA